MSSTPLAAICQIIVQMPDLHDRLDQAAAWDEFVAQVLAIACEHQIEISESDLVQAFHDGRRAWLERFL